LQLSQFDYNLPKELIAQYPKEKRDESKLLIVDRKKREICHEIFKNLPKFLKPHDLIIVNDTKVIPARLKGRKETGGQVEILLLNTARENGEKKENEQVWEVLINSSKKVKIPSYITLKKGFEVEIIDSPFEEIYLARFSWGKDFFGILDEIGETPLPHYIKRENNGEIENFDRERYQSIFAKVSGAVAAPTASLHFSQELISSLKEMNVDIMNITLHVSWGTFKPLRDETIEENRLHPEYFQIKPEVAKKINQAKEKGNRLFAVGTTVVRVLESAAINMGKVKAKKGVTSLFIYPGYRFKCVENLITNFHLPKSSLFLLVSAFLGTDFTLNIYKEAVRENYRFYSYGDGMLITNGI
jgi:S-adenosylmethionine:tRNA ribosyltransferase-isomerase